MKKRQKDPGNYLHRIPKRSDSLTWHQNLQNRVVLKVENKGFFHGAARFFARRPLYSKIYLDQLGSFVWLRINGEDSVETIAMQVEEAFGEKARPIYPRLAKYLQILKENGWIEFVNREDSGQRSGR